MEISVSELIVRYLQRLGIDTLFGMPGAHVLPIYDCLHDSRVKSVLVKHEQGAAFMAGGYARVSHQPSACIATAGPGATNLITGIANAYAERLPVLAITGETSTYIFGKGGLQESSGEGGAINQGALFASITRYHKLIERTDYLGQVLNQATQALLGREPGPVLLSIPYNVQKERVDDSVLDAVHIPSRAASRHCTSTAELVDLLRAAHSPVIIAGHGCIQAGARDIVAALSDTFNIPVTTSLKAKGVVAEGTPLSLGCLGVTSNGDAYRYLVDHADLLVFLGAGFNERTSYLWDAKLLAGKKIAQVDRDAAQLGRVFQPDVAICDDIRAVMEDVFAALQADATPPKARARLDGHQASAAQPASDDGANPAFRLMQRFYRQLAQRFPHNALVFDDNIVFAQSGFDVSDRNHYFPNTGISSLGHAIPAAIGARCFAKDSPTFAILGDGGFQMCCMEIMTAVNYGIPLNVVVINNGTLSLIRKNQFQLYDERYIDCDFVNPDFGLLAQSFGIPHYRIETEAEIDSLFARADLTGGINLIEILLDKHAFPRYLSAR
ncbi:MAG TPA: thiamine pyrophosphate-binding protein [Thiobacillus sp.]|nr:MAG: acetolactate synthase [Hydrogenophilales bacterium 16-61-112]OZA44842.1 MAG: acetolactate synthase [Hydrogenophilales bacterium 17-61-76]HQT30656.1 thiamine pyrophosphate-binding protein [Thiobacillus sp.]HQT70030.1 thiamine pyrophosphate-binding protein [Thiobacillus sp.]